MLFGSFTFVKLLMSDILRMGMSVGMGMTVLEGPEFAPVLDPYSRVQET